MRLRGFRRGVGAFINDRFNEGGSAGSWTQATQTLAGTGSMDLPISGAKVWFRPDFGITIGTGVASWAARGTSGITVAQATGSKQPTVIASDSDFGGAPSVSFLYASAQSLAEATMVLAQPMTIFCVAKSDGAVAESLVGAAATSVAGVYNNAGPPTVYGGTNLAYGSTVTAACAMVGVLNGASSKMYVNSSTVGVVSGNAGSAGISAGLGVGVMNGVGVLHGKIAEIIIYGSALSTANISTTLQYLGSRYGQSWT